MVYLLRLDPYLPWQPAAVEAAKRAAYDGFRAAAEMAPGPSRFGVIVDPRSTLILRDALAVGFLTTCTVGAVGNLDVDTEGSREAAIDPAASEATYWRVVVRFNPADTTGVPPRQLARLQRLSDMLLPSSGPRLMCDLVIPPTQSQLAHGIRAFDRELLPELTKQALAWLGDAGVVPTLWAIEGFEDRGEYERVLGGMTGLAPSAGYLVRAAGHSDVTTFELMTIGLSTAGVVGVVLGPAPFWEPVGRWMMGRTTRARAVAGVAEQFRSWVDRLEAARAWPVEGAGAGEALTWHRG